MQVDESRGPGPASVACIVEVALNGTTTKDVNPRVPRRSWCSGRYLARSERHEILSRVCQRFLDLHEQDLHPIEPFVLGARLDRAACDFEPWDAERRTVWQTPEIDLFVKMSARGLRGEELR